MAEACQSYHKVVQGRYAELVEAINTATGYSPAVFADHLVTDNIISRHGANNIVQTGEPPYNKVSKLMSIVLTQMKSSSSTQKAKKLFTDFLRIIRELNVNELPEEMEAKADEMENGYQKPVEPDVSDVQCEICKDVWFQPATLKCGHTFCRKCIVDQLEHPNGLKCPTCRKNISEVPLLYVDAVVRVCEAYNKHNPDEKKRIEEKRKNEEMSTDEFERRTEAVVKKKQGPPSYMS